MADKERYNLLYKPILRPDLDWRSEAVFDKGQSIPIETIIPEETIDDVLQDLKDLEEVSQGLPTGLEPVGEIVTKLRQRAEVMKIEDELEKLILENPSLTTPTVKTETTLPTSEIPVTLRTEQPSIVKPSVYREPPNVTVIKKKPTTVISDIPRYSQKDTIPDPGTIIIPEQLPFVPVSSNISVEESSVTGLPTTFVPMTNISISVETPKTLVQIAQESYKSDQIDLQKFYLQKMRMALQRYFHHLLGLTAELSLGDPDMLTKNYDGDNVTGVSANCRHLHDTIVRSQIQRLQKARLFKKLANADQTLVHMRAWNAAEKERERYYQEAYGDSENFIDSESNALLRQARSDYDASYKLSLYNMYKYLDSSVKLTEDILDHTLVEAKAKAKLIKEGVNIFKTAEVTTSGDTNAVQRLQAKTAEQQEAEDSIVQSSDGKTTTLTAEDIDKSRNVEDPDVDFDLAPSGGHYSKIDIDYLINSNPEIYNRDTTEGREAIKAALSITDKYMSGIIEGDKMEIDISSSNQSTNRSASQKIQDISEGKLDSLIIWN